MKPTIRSLVSLSLAVAAPVLLGSGCGRAGNSDSAGSAASDDATGGHGKTVVVNEANFAAEVEEADGVVVVDFWAPWCGPCRVIGPILEDLSTEYDGRVKIAKLNVDENRKLAVQFKANAIPMLVLFKDGKAEDMLVGARDAKDYRKWFDKYL